MTGWTIAAAELRIPWGTDLGTHRMIVIANPAGEAVRQLNGLASWWDRPASRWRHKPIGYLSTDRLRGYDSRTHRETFLPMNGASPFSRDIRTAMGQGHAPVLATGLAEADIETRLAPALAALSRINALSEGPEGGAGLAYPFMGLGLNSNSFFSTLLSAMNISEPRFRTQAWIAPGAGALLLSPAELAAIRQHASGQGSTVSSATSGARKPAISSAISSTPSEVG